MDIKPGHNITNKMGKINRIVNPGTGPTAVASNGPLMKELQAGNQALRLGAALTKDNPLLGGSRGMFAQIANNKSLPAPGTGGMGDGSTLKGTFQPPRMKKGGSVSSASKRADGCAVKGKTKGRIV